MTPDERELYLYEYDRLGAAFAENESMGEGRVSLYLGVWTAAVGGVGLLLDKESSAAQSPQLPELKKLAVAALSALLVLGVVTLVRIQKRNLHTDELIDAMARVRRLLLLPASVELFYVVTGWKSGMKERRIKPRRDALLHGGLSHVIYLANATVPVLAALLFTRELAILLPLTIGSWLAQIAATWWWNRDHHQERRRMREKFDEAIGDPAEEKTAAG
ncbi:MAG TPA: hypothetical protein VFF06_02435 [Polyangia bacterium]|nr:hypothetical protein [Polyangia bacterium]